ncbi:MULTISPECIES: diaminopimelate epimerase [unclassified Sphingobacterium]|uniref:diaminopimelate epimerase n=1 Tax=unclassified Sphingobacterium TaxID=2609468 RepID=UPI0025E29FA4|nr:MULTISPECIES: diaminopimelate epimerase [unclassified Sphingobacterium]
MATTIRFSKYQGAGNDFILVDNRQNAFDRADEALVAKLCDRRFGIGADGLMLLQQNENYDFEMVYFNADGREGSMCGNGGRCIVAFARDLGIITDKTVFLAVDGIHHASLSADLVNLQMIDVQDFARDGDAYLLQTGSPHYVEFVENLAHKNVYQDGYAIRNNATYGKDGINVNFIEAERDGYFLRTFERGVEDETYACGTGATAAAMAVAIQQNLTGDIHIPIRVLGGQLYISFHKNGQHFTKVFLKGPAQFVFEGNYQVSTGNQH